MIVDNRQLYKHQEKSGSEESFASFMTTKWYAMSDIVRQDFPKKIKITDIKWDSLRIGVGSFNILTRQIFQSANDMQRIMPYK